ncbi:hypothetical protein, partial [Streptomyces sp. NPDC089915]|uniref:hypothetical protein n=1 Tax=Streptomyces sp. NPDC089915 TaxID=3155186 RepID=UPI00341B68EA
RTRSPMIEGQILFALGEARLGSAREEEGRQHLTTALAIFRRIGSPPWEAKAHEALGRGA